MGKAMLIMDMPSKCNECEMAHPINYFNWMCEKTNKLVAHDFAGNNYRPCWCPLKEIPIKRKYGNGIYNGEVKGWNDCIEEILSE